MNSLIKSIKTALVLGGVVLFASGCDGLLTETDPSNFTQETYFTQPEHAEGAVAAIYEDLRPVHGGGFGGGPWLMLEFATGLANTELGQANNSLIVRDLDNTSDNGYGNTYWVSHYRGIANANMAITEIPEMEIDEDQKDQLLGEAKFLRAYYYYNLVRIFGEIPRIEEPIDLASEQLYAEQSSVESIYELITQDLTDAENSGLPFTDESGRVSQATVKSLLSSVYLTMAGHPLEAGSEYFERARDKAEEVIDSQEFNLFDDYDDLHNEDTENIGEHIFMVQFNQEDHTSDGIQNLIIPYNKGISEYSAETGGIFAQREFVESYEDGDRRAEEKEFYFTEFSSSSDRSETVDLGGYYIYKHLDEEAHLSEARTGLNWPLIRFAEVLLIYAEAENEVAGSPTAEAYDAVNDIRERAELSDLAGLNQDEFREAVWKERWHELSYENKTWFDMARLRQAYNVEDDTFEDFVGHSFVYGPTLTERELLFPIPTSEIRNNEKLEQNPGY